MYSQAKLLVAVDCIIFGYENDELKLLLFKRWIEPSKGELSLLGGWVNEDESVPDAARRVLNLISGLEDIYMEQVDVFSEVNRDPGGRAISIAFYSMLKIDERSNLQVSNHSATWVSLKEKPHLIFDHDLMVDKALEKLRKKASYDLFGEHLLPEKFTLLQLRKLYSAIFQRDFDPGNFRKKVLSLKVLEQLNEKDTSESKKGAYYYRFKPQNEISNNDRIFRID
jgi:ADP-ribose pyrophosphatase YjhB (NUDIX family)